MSDQTPDVPGSSSTCPNGHWVAAGYDACPRCGASLTRSQGCETVSEAPTAFKHYTTCPNGHWCPDGTDVCPRCAASLSSQRSDSRFATESRDLPASTRPAARSNFTANCKRQAMGAWRATVAAPTALARVHRQGKKQDSLSTRAGMGCLGLIVFGFVWFLIPLLAILTVGIVCAAYALVMTILWGIGSAFDGIGNRRLSGDVSKPGPTDASAGRKNVLRQLWFWVAFAAAVIVTVAVVVDVNSNAPSHIAATTPTTQLVVPVTSASTTTTSASTTTTTTTTAPPEVLLKVTGTGTATIGVSYAPRGQPAELHSPNGSMPTPLPWSETLPLDGSTGSGIGITAISTDIYSGSVSCEIDVPGSPPDTDSAAAPNAQANCFSVP